MSQAIRQPVANQVLKNRFLEDAAIALFNGGDEAVSIVAAQNGVALDSRLRQEIADHLQQSRQIHEDGVDSRKRAHHNDMIAALLKASVATALTVALFMLGEFGAIGAITTVFFASRASTSWVLSNTDEEFGPKHLALT